MESWWHDALDMTVASTYREAREGEYISTLLSFNGDSQDIDIKASRSL